jgi:hypothetical protein
VAAALALAHNSYLSWRLFDVDLFQQTFGDERVKVRPSPAFPKFSTCILLGVAPAQSDDSSEESAIVGKLDQIPEI